MPEIGEIRKGYEAGYNGHRKMIWQACEDCGKERWVRIRGNEPFPKYCRRCSCARVNGPGHVAHNWQGGYRRMSSGYVLVWVSRDDFFFPMADSDGYVREHRLVMAKHLGRCLQSWELVHHKGKRYMGIENKSDNLIDNLKLTTRGSHLSEHTKGYRDGYRQGYQDAQNAKMKELLEHIKLLEWQLREKGNNVLSN